MNHSRIVLGGLLAGLAINLVETLTWAWLFAGPYQAMLREHALVEAPWAMAGYAGSAFALGLLIAWLHAAILPRFGGAMATALRAGLAVWVAGWLIPAVWNAAMGLGLGGDLTAMRLTLGLGGVLAASLAAAAVYRERPS